MRLSNIVNIWVIITLSLVALMWYTQGSASASNTVSFAKLPADQAFHWNSSAEIEPVDFRQLRCMATAIYYESRSEPIMGKVAVARVIENRLKKGFASNICDVVFQRTAGVCQFSWSCGSYRMITPRDCPECWQVASQVLVERQYQAFMGRALYFHATYVEPGWRNTQHIRTIGGHKFFSQRGKR